jgi:prepilin-type N-terminal cleavage/methylation domain-containing protein
MHPPRGFTLIEVVVSLAILALSLGVLYQSFGWSGRSTAKLVSEEAAWLAAQSLLAEIRARPTLARGTSEGEWPGLRWQTRIDEHGSSVDSESPLQPFAVTIEVRWGQRTSQRLRLQSVEIGRGRT